MLQKLCRNHHRQMLGKIGKPPTNIHYEIIKEFYDNALPINDMDYPFVTMVRGKMIPFDRNAINEYLGRPLNLEEGETDAFSKRMQRGNWNIERISQSLLARERTIVRNAAGIPIKSKKEDMKTRAQVSLTLMLYNIRPQSHTSTVTMESSYLLYFLVESREADVVKIISNEIKTIAESGTKQGSKPNCPLAFPILIMGLCKKHTIHIPNQVHEVITSVVDERYISRYCNPKPDGAQEEDEEAEHAAPRSNIGFEEWMRTGITHNWDQNTSNRRAMSIVQKSLYNLQLQSDGPHEGAYQFMNPETIQANISWPGDRPNFMEGADAAEPEQQQPSESEESAEEEEGEEETNDEENAKGDNGEYDVDDC